MDTENQMTHYSQQDTFTLKNAPHWCSEVRLKLKISQKLNNLFLLDCNETVIQKVHITAKMPLPPLKMFWFGVKRSKVESQKWAKPKKFHFLSDPVEIENQKTHYSQNTTFTLKKASHRYPEVQPFFLEVSVM